MHPNVYLSSLWRAETIDQVFVAMSFEPRFQERFDTIVRPAIEDALIGGRTLKAFRVDNSRSGDSILTEIANGIAHSRLVLADVSTIDRGRFTDSPVRNANVLYEAGLALACRTPAEVLLIRDDNDRFLFDVSSIPHLTVDFTVPGQAIAVIRSALTDRIVETDALRDARVRMAARLLTQNEVRILRGMLTLKPDQAKHFVHPALDSPSMPDEQGLVALLRKGCIRSVGINGAGAIFYSITPFGRTVAEAMDLYLEKLEATPPASAVDPPAAS